MRHVLVLDVNGVLLTRVPGTLNERQLVPHALETVADLVRNHFGAERTFIVSRSGRDGQMETMLRLLQHRVLEATGIPADNLLFCDERDEKAEIAARLSTTHLVDNSRQVHLAASAVRNRFWFRPKEEELRQPLRVGPIYTPPNWRIAHGQIVASLRRDKLRRHLLSSGQH